MKRAFTLLELLITIGVIAILMSMVLRFGNLTKDARARALTISRIHRIESALSGYFAAFGSYPPVTLHGSRNIYLKAEQGLQSDQGEENTDIWGWLGNNGKVSQPTKESEAWDQVRLACLAQPVAAYFPYSSDYRDYVQQYSDAMKQLVPQVKNVSEALKAKFTAGFDIGVAGDNNVSRFNKCRDKVNWSEVQLFKFGLLSYLLPRYLFMTSGPREFLQFAQWTGNNELPCDPLRGTPYAGGWDQLRKDGTGEDVSSKDAVERGKAKVGAIASQAVCARWIANFEKSLTSNLKLNLFGIELRAEQGDQSVEGTMDEGSDSVVMKMDLEVYSPGSYSERSSANQYILNSVTIKDGWGNEFFYYSPMPYQGYILWSAGPNGRTFPPWVSREGLSSDAARCVEYWISDDIKSLMR